MPSWTGGPCPSCGEVMPENLVHCRRCRALLNTDLESDSVEIPVFVPLPELETVLDVAPRGYFVSCPHCDRELRIAQRYIGVRVSCNACSGAFRLDFTDPRVEKLGYYIDCPHCSERVRLARKYLGVKVACKFCQGRIRLVDPTP